MQRLVKIYEGKDMSCHLQEENQIAFIGPNAAAITGMGDKIQSKKLAVDAGVNTIPGEFVTTSSLLSASLFQSKQYHFNTMHYPDGPVHSRPNQSSIPSAGLIQAPDHFDAETIRYNQ